MSYRQRVSEWDTQIRAGQGAALVDIIRKLKAGDLPKAELPHIAGIARRLGLFKEGLDLLRDEYFKVREQVFSGRSAGAHEILMVEYAALLTEVGATKISERIFDRFPQPQYEKTFFYRALLAIKKWDHESAIRDLTAFRQLTDDPYWQNVAQLNLISSLIFQHDWAQAAQLLKSFEERRTMLSPMAQGILNELNGQYLFFTGQFSEARNHFEKSRLALEKTHNPSLMFAEKWIMIIDLLTQPWPAVESAFRAFQHRARTQGYWEIVRELDRFYALRFNDQNILSQLYFGSPSPGYRKMLCRDLSWQPPQHYSHSLGKADSKSDVFDVATLSFRGGDRKVKAMPRIGLLLMRALTSDLYRPMSAGTLFEHLYENEHFDPSFASQRVYQAIARFRTYVDEHDLQIEVLAGELGFTLSASNGFWVRYESVAESSAPIKNLEIVRLEKAFGNKAFSAQEVANSQKVSRRSANRLLNEQVAAGLLEKSGAGPSIRYKIRNAA